MPAYTYIESVNSNLICCICRTPFIEPTSASSCSHTFCKDCIFRAIDTVPQCPVDRSPLISTDLRPANNIVRNLVDELLVECPKRLLGCSHKCQRQLLDVHLKEECRFVKVQCCEEQCNASMSKKDTGRHSEDCSHLPLQCEGCGITVKSVELRAHMEECPIEETICSHCGIPLIHNEIRSHSFVCPESVVYCDNSVHGCSWSGPRNQLLSSHLPQCLYESLKGFFVSNASRISALETENTLLREKLDSLENTLRSVRQDVQQSKVSLGPWFRPEGTQAHLRPSPPTAPPPRSYLRGVSSNSLTTPESVSFPADSVSVIDRLAPTLASPPPETSLVADPLAQYFPPEATHARTHEEVSEPNLNSAFLGSSPNSSVAPLNLNTTLEGTLASLRNSVVTLAATLDSEVRRHDIALTTETLRVNEEVMALRAIVHGLRMQVHQIMMDRNSQIRGLEDEDGSSSIYSHPRHSNAGEPWPPPSMRYLTPYPPMTRLPNPALLAHLQTTKL